MESLPYRATVFLRPAGGGLPYGQFGGQFGGRFDELGPMELMERSFPTEADAVRWCRVMTEAKAEAAGIWMVTRSKGGRMFELRREHGVASLALAAATMDADALPAAVAVLGVEDDTHEVLLGTGLTLKPTFVEPDSVGLLAGELLAGA